MAAVYAIDLIAIRDKKRKMDIKNNGVHSENYCAANVK